MNTGGRKMRREEIDNLLEQIKDMRNQISSLYYDALDCKNEFDAGSEEWFKIDDAMDYINDACDNLESAADELV